MGLDLDRIARKRKELKSGGLYWKPEQGKNCIRILSFAHKVTKADVDARLFPAKDLGKFVEEVDRMVIQHFGIRADKRPVLSTPEIMRQYGEMLKKNSEAAKNMKPGKKFLLNIVDTNHIEKGVQIFAAGRTVIEPLYVLLGDDEIGSDICGVNGRDIVLIFNKDSDPATMYSITPRDAKFCKPLPSDLQTKTKDFYDPAVFSTLYADAEETAVEEAVPTGEGAEPIVEEELIEGEEEPSANAGMEEAPAAEEDSELFDTPDEEESTTKKPEVATKKTVTPAKAPVRTAAKPAASKAAVAKYAKKKVR